MRKKIVTALTIVFILSFLSPYAISLIENFLSRDSNTDIQASTYPLKEVTIQKGNYIYLGRYKDEPILWKYVDNDSSAPILLSDKIICFKSFDAKCHKCEGHEESDVQKFGTSNYKYSAIKTWLNSQNKNVNYSNAKPSKKNVFMGFNSYENESGFLSSDNFTDSQKDLIDYAFLLSKSQMKKIPQKERRKSATKSAIKSNESSFLILPNMKVWYWTSSGISTNNVSVCTVTTSGSFYKALAFDSVTGICPALKLKSAKINVTGGNGTKKNPYIIAKIGE